MRRKRWIVLVLVLVLLAAGVALWRALTRSGLPQREGTAELRGTSAPVTIRWNDWGVPHVVADSAVDLAEAVGWLHANDRFTQMELGRRLASGRLAQLVGDAALPSDRYFVSMGFRQIAARYEASAGEETRALLVAYARGVNAWLDQRGSDLPPELRLLGAAPEPWSPRDSLYFQLQMAHELSFWQGRPEEPRFGWLAVLGADRLRDLMGETELHVPPEIEALAAAAREGTVGGSSGGADIGGSPGSNNWALAPTRTATGAAIVANDPHLPLSQPGFWYQVMLRAPDYEAAGMTLPGLPFVVLGRGARVAWAFTNVMLDDHDLFLERLDPGGTAVRRGDRWEPVRETVESIARSDGSTETVTVRWTDRGLLLPSDPERGLPDRSLAWTANEDSDAASVFLRFARAGNVLELTGTLDGMAAPAQNLVAADVAGNILHQPVGRVPDRRTGDGRLPSPGWDPDYGWNGLLPQAGNPLRLNPDEGLLVTANHDIRLPPHAATPLVADFDTSYRADRIRQLLERRRDWTPAAMAEVQRDVRSLYAREVVRLLGDDHVGPAARAVTALRAWDGEMTDTGAAALFALTERALLEAIFRDEADVHALPSVAGRGQLVRALAGELDPLWFDDLRTEPREGRREIVGVALERAWDEVVERYGDDPDDWSYSALHPLTLAHPLAALPLLGSSWSRGPFAMPGSATTVAAFGGGWVNDRSEVWYGPSMRWVSDLSDPDGSLVGLPTGQSGHPWDPHYDDQLELYLEGRLRPAHWSDAAIETNTVARLTLVPTAVGIRAAGRK